MLSKKKRIIVVISLVLLPAFTLLAMLAFKNNPEDVVKKYWKACLTGDFETAIKLKPKGVFPRAEPPSSEPKGTGEGKSTYPESDEYKQIYPNEIAKNKLKIVKIIETKQDQYNAMVRVETEDAEKTKDIYVNCLVKLGTEWVIADVGIDFFEDPSPLCFPIDKPLRPRFIRQSPE